MAKTYEAMLKTDQTPSSGWHFLDLKNRKQTGDLEKKILHLNQKKEFRVFNFTSCREDEGVSTVLLNLMNYMKHQKYDKKVLIVDAHLRAPCLHMALGLKPENGLTDLLAGRVDLTAAIQSLDTADMGVIPCGSDHGEMAGNISLEKIGTLLTEAKKHYDFIFLDSAPVLSSTDALSTAAAADTTFLVIQSLTVRTEAALKAKTLLLDNECAISGVVLNRVDQDVIPGWLYRLI